MALKAQQSRYNFSTGLSMEIGFSWNPIMVAIDTLNTVCMHAWLQEIKQLLNPL